MSCKSTNPENDEQVLDFILGKISKISDQKKINDNNNIIDMNNKYSKMLNYICDNEVLPSSDDEDDENYLYNPLKYYQWEEEVYDINGNGKYVKALFVPMNTEVFVKFYTVPKVSEISILWYNYVARWMLINKILPNLDVPLESKLTGLVSLKYQTRFKKILGQETSSVYYVSKPDLGKTLHELIDEQLISEAELFEICKQVDISIEVYSKIGFAHGNLTPDNVRVVNLNKTYNFRVGKLLVSTQHLAIPCNFDDGFIITNSVLHKRKLTCDQDKYKVKHDSNGRYDYNVFYMSLLYLLTLNGEKNYKYANFKNYLIHNNLQPISNLNQTTDFKISKIFDIGKAILESSNKGVYWDTKIDTV